MITIHSNKVHNPDCSKHSDHVYRIRIIGGSGSEETNVLLNLSFSHLDIDKIYLYAKDQYEPKYQLLTSQHKEIGLKHLEDLKTFSEYSTDMKDVYLIIDKYNPGKNAKY